MGEDETGGPPPLAEVIETSGAAVVGITADGLVSAWNSAAEELYGYHSSEMVGRPLSLLRCNGAEREWTHAFDGALLGRRTEPITVTRRHRDGRELEVSVYLGPMRVVETPSRIVAEPSGVAELERSIDDLPLWFESLPVTTFVVDLEGRFLQVSGPELRKVGLGSADLLGTEVFDFLDQGGRTVFERALTGEEFTVSAMVGGEIWETSFAPLYADGDLVAICGCVLDATARWRNEEALVEGERRLERLALEDLLTGLPNRARLFDRIVERMSAPARAPLAAIVVDLDQFHLVNDSHGHAFGDEVLLEVADRLRARCHGSDTAARLGADTFVVLRTGLADPTAVEGLARSLLDDVARPIDIAGTSVTVTASSGIAIDTGEYDSAEELVADADAAMYAAKRQGRDRTELYVESYRQQARERLQTEHELRSAIDSGELRVFYQPVIGLDDGRLTGVEALVRWQHPVRGLVPPVAFISLAEETGLIVPLGEYVLREACRQGVEWAAAGIDLHVSVNLSPRQLSDRNFAQTLSGVLEETGHPAERLTLEVTESVLVDDAVKGALEALTNFGVSLAIDDFGTGYSSLVALRRLPVDTLKIDRSFVGGLGRDDEDEAIIDAVVNLGKALGLRIVAEGVETEEQRNQLRVRGCEEAQGFLFQRPVPAAELGAWVRARETALAR